MNTYKLLSELCLLKGVSGDEKYIADYIYNKLSSVADKIEYQNGNVIAYINGTDPNLNNAPLIMLDAHTDKVGLIVTDITDSGIIHIAAVGGLDAAIMPAQRVIVHGKKDIPGVVSALAPHLAKGNEGVTPVEKCVIDTGYSGDELKKIISRGDIVSFKPSFEKLLGNFVTGTSLDDRAGVAALIKVAEDYKNSRGKANLALLFSTQEELGEFGAANGCFYVNPDIAVAVDVSFAKSHDDNSYECGDFEKGPMIGISPSLSREISDEFIKTAEKNNIPYQIEVMEGKTGTNADRFSTCRGGKKSCTVSIPLRYMHTPAEVVSTKDVDLTAELLADFVRSVNS